MGLCRFGLTTRTRAPLCRAAAASASGTMPVLVHRDRLQMLAEPAGEVAQAAVAQRLGQNGVAGACQGQQRRGQRALGTVGQDDAVGLGGEPRCPSHSAAAVRCRSVPATSG